jgi:hypothetical protein
MGLATRFYMAPAFSAADETAVRTACADCGASVTSAGTAEAGAAEARTALCAPCYTTREATMRVAAQKGFRLGL